MRRARPLLGTLVEIDAGDDDAATARALERAFLAIERVHALMSFHEDGSDVARMNRLAPLRRVDVHPWTWRVLATAARLHRETRGAFDCAVGAELVRRRRLPPPAGIEPDGARGGTFADVALQARCGVRFTRPLVLDLGGIAKGFAVDQAVRLLRRAGIASGVVNAGGDLRAFGPVPKRVHIRDPRDPSAPALVGEISNAALATSASYFLDSAKGRGASAIVDPHRRRCVPVPGSVSVVAPTCMIADALTKVVAITGNARGCGLSRWSARALVL